MSASPDAHSAIALYCDEYSLSSIPLGRPGTSRYNKALPEWKQWQTQIPPQPVREEWKQRYPQCNVAILTGMVSDCFVVDVDSEEANDVFRSKGKLPDTWSVRTGDGFHYYFSYPPYPLGNRANILKHDTLKIDIRGQGGYVAAPPSIHESGSEYTWLTPPKDFELADAPQWVHKLILPDDQFPCYKYALSGVTKECERVASSEKGHRNDTLNQAAFSIGTLVGGNYITRPYAERQLLLAAQRITDQSEWDRAGVRATIKSGLDAGIQKPRTIHVKATSVNGSHDDTPSTQGTKISVRKLAKQAAKSSEQSDQSLVFPKPPDPPEQTRCALPDDAEYTKDEVGNSRIFVDMHGDKVLYNHTAEQWYIWDGIRWEPCEMGEVQELAIDVTDWLLEIADEKDTKMQAHIKASRKHAGLRAMLANATSRPSIRVKQETLDSDPWIVNCWNGTIDLKAFEHVDDQLRGERLLRDHDQTDRITKTLRGNFNLDADDTRWIDFLHQIHAGDADMVEFLQRAVGYCLTGTTREQCFFLLVGLGKNGKTVFREVLRFLWNDYAIETPFDTFIPRHNHGVPRPEIVDLQGSRLIVASEGPERCRLDDAIIKLLTGGEQIAARRLYSDLVRFHMQGKIWLTTNHKPAVTGNDEGMWRRLLLIPHNVQISDDDDDPLLTRRLQCQADAVLKWALYGLWKYMRHGLEPPQAVRLATQQYRSEQDILGLFLSEYVVTSAESESVTKQDFVLKSDLYAAFEKWMKANGEKPWASRTLGKNLRERTEKLGIDEANKGAYGGRAWTGMKLKKTLDEEPAQQSF